MPPSPRRFLAGRNRTHVYNAEIGRRKQPVAKRHDLIVVIEHEAAGKTFTHRRVLPDYRGMLISATRVAANT